MNRIGPALAAVFLGVVPAHAESIRISTAGKSDVEVKAQVASVAARLCASESAGSLLDLQLRAVCARDTVQSTLAASQPAKMTQVSDASAAGTRAR